MPVMPTKEWLALQRQAAEMKERGMSNFTPTICVDFDGVLHSYRSGWKGAGEVPDPPVDGAMEFLVKAAMSHKVNIAIYSSRSKEEAGIRGMKDWLIHHIYEYLRNEGITDLAGGTNEIMSRLSFPTEKPAAIMTIDDRAHCFNGRFRTIEWYVNFKPWNKRKPEEDVPDYDMQGCIEVDEQRADEALEVLQDCLLTNKDGYTTFEGSAQEFLASFFRDARQNAALGIHDKRGVAELIGRALEYCSSMCLDNEEERQKVRAAVMDSLFAPQSPRDSWKPQGKLWSLHELLTAVLRPTEVPSFDIVAGWTEQERQEVRDWAEVEHYRCTEITAITSREMPEVLKRAIEGSDEDSSEA